MTKVARSKNVTILAIESSCDETAAAILQGDPKSGWPNFIILSSVVRSQMSLHKKTGGVIPEVAARAHVAAVAPITKAALKQADLELADLDHIAVTTGPGLIVSLIVGTEFAKALAMATKKTMIPVNHMAGHLYSIFSNQSLANNLRQPLRARRRSNPKLSSAKFPLVALVVSGGHTMLILMRDYLRFEVLGQTVDDAAGEAFDKVARLLGLPYPGGPVISALALRGKPSIQFPRPMVNTKNYDFSFSGLKTAVLYYMRDQMRDSDNKRGADKHAARQDNTGKHYASKKIFAAAKLTNSQKANIAASFQQAVVDVLIAKTLGAAKEYKAKTVSLSGGVAANKKLRRDLAQAARKSHLNFIVPNFELCTDNAAMIAIAAYFRLRGGYKPVTFRRVNADSNWEL